VDLIHHISFQQSEGSTRSAGIRLKILATAEIVEVDYILKEPG
jgi:hypothetical protein